MNDRPYRVYKVANLEDEATCNAYEIFQFKTVQGDTRSVRIDRRRSREVRYVYRELLQANAALPSSERDALFLVQTATEAEPSRRMLHAGKLGWRPNGDGFVLRDKCLGLVGQVLPPIGVEKTTAPQLQFAGTLKSWQQTVAIPAGSSSRLTVAILCGFAAPLLRWTEMQNFGVSVFGLTAEEREAMAEIAISVIGRDLDRNIPDWWAAPDHLIKKASGYADLLFVSLGGAPPNGRQGSPTSQELRLERLRSGEIGDGRGPVQYR